MREEVVHFGDDGQLFGIVASSPVAARIDRPAVLLVNGGGNHRAGINRSHTEWSRAWVSAGLMVLRMDVRGLGDSAGGPYPAGKILYRSETQADVRAGLDLLAARYGHDRVIVIGLCAGAYQAFHVALADPRVVGLVMLNPLRFQSVDELAPGERSEVEYAPLGHYLRAALDVAAWRRLASEGRDPRVFVRFVAKRLHARVTGGVGELASIVRGRPPRPGSWLAGALLHLVGRGARVLVVFDDTNPIRPAFDESLAVDRERLAKSGSFRVELLTGADHIFSPLVSQERLAALLFDTLEAWTNLTPDLAAGGLVACAR